MIFFCVWGNPLYLRGFGIREGKKVVVVFIRDGNRKVVRILVWEFF